MHDSASVALIWATSAIASCATDILLPEVGSKYAFSWSSSVVALLLQSRMGVLLILSNEKRGADTINAEPTHLARQWSRW